MKEIWKDIPGYPGYKVSNLGSVKSKDRVVKYSNGVKRFYSGKELSQGTTKKGYKYVYPGFSKNGKRNTVGVHRLVAIAFIPNPEAKPFINHIDGNPSNNRVDNLEWSTPCENSRHAKYILKNTHYGSPCHKVVCVETGITYDSIRDAWRATGVHWSNIAKSIAHREGRAKAGGYHWKKI